MIFCKKTYNLVKKKKKNKRFEVFFEELSLKKVALNFCMILHATKHFLNDFKWFI